MRFKWWRNSWRHLWLLMFTSWCVICCEPFSIRCRHYLFMIPHPSPLTPHPPKEERIPTMIDPNTQHVWKVMRQALCKRFYSNLFYRKHRIDGKVVGYLNCFSLYIDDVKFSYIIEMQVMLFLGLYNNKLIDNMVQALETENKDVPNSWLIQELRKSAFLRTTFGVPLQDWWRWWPRAWPRKNNRTHLAGFPC